MSKLAAILSEPSVASRWPRFDEERVRCELLCPAPDDALTVWGIDVDGELAGAIQLGEETEPDYRHGSIDLFVATRWQGSRVGPRAIAAVVDIAFGERALHRLVIDPAADNEHAIRAYARLGFRAVGRLRQYERGPDGTLHDGLLMERLRDAPQGAALTLAPDITLRRSGPDDDDVIVSMCEAMYQEDPCERPMQRADVKRTLRHFLRHPERGAALVVEGKGSPVGYAFLCAFWSNELGGLVAVVDELFVVPEARARGIGTLVIEAVAAGRVDGFAALAAVELEVTPTNERALALYERLGFQAAPNARLRRKV